MSDSKKYSVARTARFGAVAVVAAAGGVVGLATPAAAADLTPSQLKGPVAGTNTITLPGSGLTSPGNFPATSTVQFNSATCPTNPGTAAGTSIVAVAADKVTGGGTATLSIVVPGTVGSPVLAAGAYNICVYNGTAKVGGTVTATKYTAVATSAGTLDVSRGTSAGGNTVILTDTTTQFGAGTAVQFNSASACPTTFTALATGTIATTATPTMNGDKTTATVTVPSGLTGATYSVCAYTGSTAGTSALVSKVDAGYGLIAPLTIAPASGPAAGTNTVKATATSPVFVSTPRVQFSLLPCPTVLPSTIAGVVVAAGTATPADGGTTLTFKAPALLTTSYYVCAYQDAGVGTGLVGSTSAPAYTAGAAGALTLDVATGSAAGGTVVAVADASAAFDSATRIQLSSVACPSTAVQNPNTTTVATVTPGSVAADTHSASITIPSGLTASRYFVCAYTGSTSGSALVSGTSTASFDVVHPMTLSMTTGPAGGGYQITGTDVNGEFSGTVGVRFTSAACPTTYGSGTGVAGSATIPAASTTTVTITVPVVTPAAYYVCTYRGNSSGSELNSETTTAAFTARDTQALTLSTTSGNATVANSFTAAGPTGFVFPTDAVVRFIQTTACPQPAGTVVTNTNVVAAGVRRVSPGNKLAITTGNMTALSRKVCVYNSAADTLLAESTVNYVTAAGVAITEISPAAGPAQGKTLIRVDGANFAATGMTASIGGIPLTEVTVGSVTGGLGTFFTAITPAHAPGGPFDLVVSSPSGPVTMTGAFSYSNGIEISPSNAPNTDSVDVSVSGVGFAGIDFETGTPTVGATPAAAGGHVYLVKGEYDPTELHTATFKVNDMLLECVDVLVIDDTELVCTLHLTGKGGISGSADVALRPAWHSPTGTTPSNDATIVKGSNTLVSTSDAAYTAADIGLTVVNTNLPKGTTIVQVVNGTTVILSQRATADITGAQVDYLAPRTEPVSALSEGDTITDANFAGGADAGRQVTGVGIQPGTVIESVSGNIATLSKPILTAGATSIVVGEPAVPVGAYTITVVSNGAVDADVDDLDYTQSIITSTSTFTVADY